MRSLRRKKEGGFTLVELMIVVAIIGILAAIAIPQFAAYRERGFIASMMADAKATQTAEEAYFADPNNGTYVALTATGDASASALGPFGLKTISAGNTVTVAASGDIKTGFLITVTTDKVPAAKLTSVTFDSVTGEMKQNKP